MERGKKNFNWHHHWIKSWITFLALLKHNGRFIFLWETFSRGTCPFQFFRNLGSTRRVVASTSALLFKKKKKEKKKKRKREIITVDGDYGSVVFQTPRNTFDGAINSTDCGLYRVDDVLSKPRERITHGCVRRLSNGISGELRLILLTPDGNFEIFDRPGD